MSLTFLLLLMLYHMQIIIRSEIIDTPLYNLKNVLKAKANNDLKQSQILSENIDVSDNNQNNEKNNWPFLTNTRDQTDLQQFKYPTASAAIDYTKNLLTLQFQKQHDQPKIRHDSEEEDEVDKAAELNRKSLENNFIRFGKRQLEEMPNVNYAAKLGERYQRNTVASRDSRGDNFMRFGRKAKDDFMRFGRNTKDDFMRFGRNPQDDFMRFGRSPQDDFMRFGRRPQNDFMRFGRNANDELMHFERKPKNDFMRFGRSVNANENFMRFGRANNLLNTIDKNFMRFGRTLTDSATDKSSNFMRFGKRTILPINEVGIMENKQNKTKIEKNEIKEAAKLLKQFEHVIGNDENNPIDQAIKVLYNKKQQQEQQQQLRNGQQTEHEHENNEIILQYLRDD